ncbi:MAG: DEAD/DEAH box helicase, partial [Spirochaetota bacterium]
MPTKTYSVKLNGWNENYKLDPHQWQTIHHLFRNGKGISALGVGFGKTSSAIGLMLLGRQEGKFSKPIVQVPNNKVGDWIDEIKMFAPDLKVGAVNPKDKEYNDQDKRFQMYQDLANGSYDVIILPETAATEIGLSTENDKKITDAEITSQMLGENKTAKEAVNAEDSQEKKLRTKKKNPTITFEDFGGDAFFVDEAHRGKNLFTSSLAKELGMNDKSEAAQRALEMFKKSAYIRSQNGGKNVFLLTATPLTNSPLEYYNMLAHVGLEDLRRIGINNLDDFIGTFANVEDRQVQTMDGSGLGKTKKVLVGFKNLDKLRGVFFKHTDLQNDPEKVGLDKPEVVKIPIVLDSDTTQKNLVKGLFEGMVAAFNNRNTGEGIKKYGQIRAASLDPRLIEPNGHENWKNPKIESMINNIKDASKDNTGGHVVFCDHFRSIKEAKGSFNLHHEIKQQFIANGYKPEEIGIISGESNQKKNSQAITDYNAGKIKILIGTTQTMGEGVNLQANSTSLHHFDFPYRPSDIIQRNGRIDRQGNAQKLVKIYNYMASGTADAYNMDLIQKKANWIADLLNSKSDVFTNPDEESTANTEEMILALTN